MLSFKKIGRLEMSTKKPVQIENGEWIYFGCFIQKQNHPNLLPFFVFKNNENQDNVGCCYTFTEAKKLCKQNEVKNQYLNF